MSNSLVKSTNHTVQTRLAKLSDGVKAFLAGAVQALPHPNPESVTDEDGVVLPEVFANLRALQMSVASDPTCKVNPEIVGKAYLWSLDPNFSGANRLSKQSNIGVSETMQRDVMSQLGASLENGEVYIKSLVESKSGVTLRCGFTESPAERKAKKNEKELREQIEELRAQLQIERERAKSNK